MATTISQSQYDAFKDAVENATATGNMRDIQAAWASLRDAGDRYAAIAYDGLSYPSGFYGSVIAAAWSASRADTSKFGAIALNHLSN